MSEGTPGPATWPRCRGPLAYGQATATRMRCGVRFGKSVLRAGLGLEHLTEGRRARPRRNRRLDASPAGNSDCQEHEAEGSHQREQEPPRARRLGLAGLRRDSGHLRNRPRLLAKGVRRDGSMSRYNRRAHAGAHQGPPCGRRRGSRSLRSGHRLGAARFRFLSSQARRHDNRSRMRRFARRTTGASCRSRRLHGREIRVERLRRRD
jgi:hypothetical protein